MPSSTGAGEASASAFRKARNAASLMGDFVGVRLGADDGAAVGDDEGEPVGERVHPGGLPARNAFSKTRCQNHNPAGLAAIDQAVPAR